MKQREPEIGDRVKHSLYGTGTITEIDIVLFVNDVCVNLVDVYFDSGILLSVNWGMLERSPTKSPIKPKVKRWRWVLQKMPFYCSKNSQKTLWITPEHWTQEEIEQTAKKHKLEVIEKLNSTEKEFDE